MNLPQAVPFVQSAIVNRLRTAEGGIVLRRELIEAAYPNPDDEPDDPVNVICACVSYLRRRGFPIYGTGRGYRFVPTVAPVIGQEVVHG